MASSVAQLRTYRQPPASMLAGGYVRRPRQRELIPPMTTYMPPQYIDSGKAEFGNTLNNPVWERDIPTAVASTGRVVRLPTWSTQDQWWAGPDLVTNEVNNFPDSDPTMTAGYVAAYNQWSDGQQLYPSVPTSGNSMANDLVSGPGVGAMR